MQCRRPAISSSRKPLRTSRESWASVPMQQGFFSAPGSRASSPPLGGWMGRGTGWAGAEGGALGGVLSTPEGCSA